MKVKEYVPALGAVLLAALLLTAVSFALRGMQEERSRAALEQQLTLLLPGSFRRLPLIRRNCNTALL